MNTYIDLFLMSCNNQKGLSYSTIRAYACDLNTFDKYLGKKNISEVSRDELLLFVEFMHSKYKPKTVKRKISVLKSFFSWLKRQGYILDNPFLNLYIPKYREPKILPKIIPMNMIEGLLSFVYLQQKEAPTIFQRKNALRDTAVLEVLFATGMRISELCHLKPADINLTENNIFILGKGAKERQIQIGCPTIISLLQIYQSEFSAEISHSGYFFSNQRGNRFSEQSVRRMLNRYGKKMLLSMHITPHMFRHSFATYLLDADVDIRYIQNMLGHSSIRTTEIYTHVSVAKQREILSTRHPRNRMNVKNE